MKHSSKFLFAFSLLSSIALFPREVLVPYFTLKHVEAGGVGYQDGYTSIEGMLSFFPSPNWIPFIDARRHVLNNGATAFNVGTGLRAMIGSSNVILGVNAYYDERSSTGKSFRQASGGIEVLSPSIDFRANGYFPIDNPKDLRSVNLFGFVGNNLLLTLRERMALTGTDAEVGSYLGSISDLSFYLAAGGYFFKRQQCNTKAGFQSRLKMGWNDNFYAQLSVTHDSLYQTNVQGTLGISIPFWKRPTVKFKSYFPSLKAYQSQPVQRQELIVLCNQRRQVVATGPNGNSIVCWFVNNTNPGGTGTFQNPFYTLLEAQNAAGSGDCIYVFTGDGTSFNMNQGLILKTGQSLLGDSVPQTIITQYGPIVFPAQSSQNPAISNIAGNGLTLADNTTVRGIDILASSLNSIYGSGIDNVLVDQVNLVEMSDGNYGIFLEDTSMESVSFTFSNGTISQTMGLPGQLVHVELNDNGNSSLQFINNDFIMREDIEILTSNNVSANISFLNNDFRVVDPAFFGDSSILITTDDDSSVVLNFSNNTMTEMDEGVRYEAYGSSLIDFTYNNNTATGDNTNAFDLRTFDSTSGVYSSQNNTFTGIPFGNPWRIQAFNSSTVSGIFSNNSCDNTLAVLAFVSDSASVDLLAENNTLLNSTDFGFNFSTFIGTPILNVTLRNNTIDSTAGSGISMRSEGGNLNATLLSNTVQNAISSGIEATVVGGTLTLTATSNQVNTNGGNGIELFADTPGIINSSISNNTLNGNTLTGFSADQTNASSFCLLLSGNTSSNGYSLTADAGTPDFSAQSPAPVSLASIQADNTGTISTTGTITYVPIGGCP